ncbi:MAG: ABC transporter ATP-binding protein [Bacteroidota bacterium]
MPDPLFSISNLTCEYFSGQPVLEIPKLEIPNGRLIFVIGRSGIGKSTFIETLGLMNNTIANRSTTQLQFTPNEKAIELKESWQWSNDQLSGFRKQHFSFIFQNTNLMPNFTCGENMIISLLIKGKSFEAAKSEVVEMMERLALDKQLFDKRITEISGGQRQRLAFVRAVTADFDVLFGDEPTGNLDRMTAYELMSILKEIVKDKGKTCILVSHDLDLAEKFADIVIPIAIDETSSTERTIGRINESNIIQKIDNQWTLKNENLVASPTEYLNAFLQQPNPLKTN